VGQATWRVALIAGEGRPALCPALPALVAGEGRQPLQIDRIECMIQNTGHYRLKTKKKRRMPVVAKKNAKGGTEPECL
jgi:hypothetical protein